MESEITVDDLKAERTWLIQHGCHDLMTVGGMTLLAAVRQTDADVKKLNAEIAKMEGAAS